MEVWWLVVLRLGADGLEGLEGSLVVIECQVASKLIQIERFHAASGAEEQADFSFPTALSFVNILDESAEWRDAGADSDHEQIGVLVFGHLELQAIRTSDADCVSGDGVTKVVGGEARVSLAADVVDREATTDTDGERIATVIVALAGTGDGIKTKVVIVAELIWAGGENADALPFDIVKGLVVEAEDQMSHFCF